jgi:hypothetical protein
LDSASVPAPGGRTTGKNPTDKGKWGSKRHIVVDREGIPLSVTHSAANVHDSKVLEETVDAISPIGKPRGGRPRKRPKKLHAVKGYDFPRCCEALNRRRSVLNVYHAVSRCVASFLSVAPSEQTKAST